MVKCYNHDKMWCEVCMDTRTKKLWKLAQEKCDTKNTFLTRYYGPTGVTSHFKLITSTSKPESDTLRRMEMYLWEQKDLEAGYMECSMCSEMRECTNGVCESCTKKLDNR